jgi:hypothetical protein
MSDYATELRQRVDEVLHYVWDPIGIAGNPHGRDEYAAYVSHMIALLENNAPAEQIAHYLNEVATQSMGLQPNDLHSLAVAQRLLAWKAKLLQQRPAILG